MRKILIIPIIFVLILFSTNRCTFELSEIDKYLADTTMGIWAGKFNSGIYNLTGSSDTIQIGVDAFPEWARKVNYMIDSASVDTIIYGTDNFEVWRTQYNSAYNWLLFDRGVIFKMDSSSLTYIASGNDVTYVNDSIVVLDGTANVVKGNSVRFGSASTDPIYKILSVRTDTLILDQTFGGIVTNELYWGGIDTLYDISGNSHNGTQTVLSRMPKLLWKDSDLETNNYDGTIDYLGMGDAGDYPLTKNDEWTISLNTFFPDSAIIDETIFSIYNNADDKIAIGVDASNIFWAGLFNGVAIISSNDSLLLNQWVNLIVTYKNDTIQLYVNGVKSTGIGGNISATVTSPTVRIGTRNPGGSGYNGSIDGEVAYNRVFNEAEIVALSNAQQAIFAKREVTVIFIFGQSNAYGNNSAPSESWLNGVIANSFMFNTTADEWQPLEYGVNNESTLGHAIELNYAYTESQETNRDVYEIKVAQGGTSLGVDWQKGNFMFDKTVEKSRLAINSLNDSNFTIIYKAVYWNQGERDAAYDSLATPYQTNLETFVADLRDTIPELANIPFIACRLSSNLTGRTYLTEVQDAVENAVIANYQWIDQDFVIFIEDDLHINSESQNQLAIDFRDLIE